MIRFQNIRFPKIMFPERLVGTPTGMIWGLDEEPVLVGVTGIAGGHGWLFVLGRQAGTRSRVPDEMILGQFPFLVLGDLAVFASEVTAPKAQSVSTGV